MKKTFLIFVSFLILGCTPLKYSEPFIMETAPNPPGTVKIGENLFIDTNEMSNINYREFLYWQKAVYGKESEKYRKMLPDTMVWCEIDTSCIFMVELYLTHPAFESYPVVGVTFEQALEYTKWRSDRVMQIILMRNEVIPYDFSYPDSTNVFTIEKYFNREYLGIVPPKEFMIYPYYFLPDSATFFKAAQFDTTVNVENLNSCRKKFR